MPVKSKKENKNLVDKESLEKQDGLSDSVSITELRTFLLNIKDKMTEDAAAPVYVMSAVNRVLNLPNIYELLDNENKELARDVWLRLKQTGLQLKNPPLLFGADEDGPRVNG